LCSARDDRAARLHRRALAVARAQTRTIKNGHGNCGAFAVVHTASSTPPFFSWAGGSRRPEAPKQIEHAAEELPRPVCQPDALRTAWLPSRLCTKRCLAAWLPARFRTKLRLAARLPARFRTKRCLAARLSARFRTKRCLAARLPRRLCAKRLMDSKTSRAFAAKEALGSVAVQALCSPKPAGKRAPHETVIPARDYCPWGVAGGLGGVAGQADKLRVFFSLSSSLSGYAMYLRTIRFFAVFLEELQDGSSARNTWATIDSAPASCCSVAS